MLQSWWEEEDRRSSQRKDIEEISFSDVLLMELWRITGK